MKVGIVTLHLEKNYGAVLQTYALQETIREMGHQPCIIGFHPQVVEKHWENTRFSDINSGAKFARFLCERTLFRYQIARCRREFWEFFRERYSCTDPLYQSYEAMAASPPDCDAFIVGSDQVWNPKVIHPKYFLEFAGDKKRISYAASFGTSSLPEKYAETYRNALAKFAHISCREPQGCEIVNELLGGGGVISKLVLDPTLLRLSSDWQKLITSDIPQDWDLPDFPYILVYDHGANSITTDTALFLKKKTGYKVVLVGPFDKKYLDTRFDRRYCVGPLGFLKLVQKAKLVVTVSFHGTILSYFLRTPFLTVCKNAEYKMDPRIHNLLSILKLSDRRITGIADVPPSWETCDFTAGDENVCAERQKSLDFLKNALGN